MLCDVGGQLGAKSLDVSCHLEIRNHHLLVYPRARSSTRCEALLRKRALRLPPSSLILCFDVPSSQQRWWRSECVHGNLQELAPNSFPKIERRARQILDVWVSNCERVRGVEE